MASTYLDRVSNKALGQMLVEKGALSQEQVNEALEISKRQGIRLGEALVSLGYIGGDALSYAIAEQYGQRPMELHPSMVDERLLARFDLNFLSEHMMLPLIDLGSALVVVVGDPNELAGLDELAQAWPSGQIITQLGAPAQIQRCLEHFRIHAAEESPTETPIGAECVTPRELPDFEAPPSADAPEFGLWLLRMAAENWGADLIVREIDSALQVAVGGEKLTELGRWPNRAPLDILDLLLLESEPVSFTGGQAHFVAPGMVGGNCYHFMIATPAAPGPAFAWIRALRRPHRSVDPAVAEGIPQFPEAGRCTIVEHSGEDRLDLLIAQMAAVHGAEHQVLIITSGLRSALLSTPEYPAPFVDVAAAAQAHRATAVIFDFPPTAAEISRLMAAMHPHGPAVVVFAAADNSAAVESLASLPGTQRVQYSGFKNTARDSAGQSAQAEKGNA